MVKKDEAQAISYKESKLVNYFYKKLDNAIRRAARKGYTSVMVPDCGFEEAELLYLLRPYYLESGENYGLIRRTKTVHYLIGDEGTEYFVGFLLKWTKPPIKINWRD
jgi:hypothetical protein